MLVGYGTYRLPYHQNPDKSEQSFQDKFPTIKGTGRPPNKLGGICSSWRDTRKSYRLLDTVACAVQLVDYCV